MLRSSILASFALFAFAIAADGQVSGGVSGPLGTLNFNFGQSSSRSSVSTSAGVTTLDGYPGSIFSGTIRPFVIGFTPVVGDYPVVVDHASQIRQQQLSMLYQSQSDAVDKRLFEYLRRAERAEADGNQRMARANYRRAFALAAEPLKQQLLSRLKK